MDRGVGDREGGAVGPPNQWKNRGGMFYPRRFCGALQPKSLTGECIGQLGLPLAPTDRSLGHRYVGGGLAPPEQRLTEPMSTKRAVGWALRRGSGLTPMGDAGVERLNG